MQILVTKSWPEHQTLRSKQAEGRLTVIVIKVIKWFHPNVWRLAGVHAFLKLTSTKRWYYLFICCTWITGLHSTMILLVGIRPHMCGLGCQWLCWILNASFMCVSGMCQLHLQPQAQQLKINGSAFWLTDWLIVDDRMISVSFSTHSCTSGRLHKTFL